jgi:hypothetical protein
VTLTILAWGCRGRKPRGPLQAAIRDRRQCSLHRRNPLNPPSPTKFPPRLRLPLVRLRFGRTLSWARLTAKRRRKTHRYYDFRTLPGHADEDILFFGGRDYLPLFFSLTAAIKTRRTVFYNSVRTLQATGCVLKRFETSTRTNWHYECANAFLDGVLSLA